MRWLALVVCMFVVLNGFSQEPVLETDHIRLSLPSGFSAKPKHVESDAQIASYCFGKRYQLICTDSYQILYQKGGSILFTDFLEFRVQGDATPTCIVDRYLEELDSAIAATLQEAYNILNGKTGVIEVLVETRPFSNSKFEVAYEVRFLLSVKESFSFFSFIFPFLSVSANAGYKEEFARFFVGANEGYIVVLEGEELPEDAWSELIGQISVKQ